MESRDAQLQKERGKMEEMKTNVTSRVVEVKGEKKLLEHKLEHYLQLEEEVDKMVETGHTDDRLFPVSSSRRTRQAVFLARQVNESRKELEGVYLKLRDTEKEKAALEIELDRLKQLNKQYVRI